MPIDMPPPLVELCCPAVREMLRDSESFAIPFDGPVVESVLQTLLFHVYTMQRMATSFAALSVQELCMAITLGDYLGSDEMVSAAGTHLAKHLRDAPVEYINTMLDLGASDDALQRDYSWLGAERTTA
jgi:hypothetical protein